MKKEEIIKSILNLSENDNTDEVHKRIWNAALTFAANVAEPKATFEEPEKTICIKSGDWFVTVDKSSIIKHKFD